MIPSNPIPQVCNYGSSASYCTCPSDEQIANGTVPLDSLPAAWWNWLWSKTNTAVNCARYAAGILIDEVNTVLAQAGVCVNPSCVDQLYRAINNIRQTIGTAEVAGAVKSSSTASEVAINPTTGVMSVNCLGNAASLTTTASTIVGAINELKSTYDTCTSGLTTAVNGKAPTAHASSATTYGVGNADCYGHLKISDQYTSVLSACSGVAASQYALATVYGVAAAKAAVGNTAGCALGTASAGSASTAARSDHVHPLPSALGGIAINPGACASYNEGIRINVANNNFATLNIGGAANSVCGAGGFWIGTNCAISAGKLYVNYGASNKDSYFCCNVDGTVYWYGNVRGSLNGRASCACCNGSGTPFGTAAVYNIRTGGSVTYVPYSGTDANCVLTGNFLAFWNGAFNSSGGSNFLYTAVGKLQSAATCAATAFRASNWWPDSLTNGCVCRSRLATCAIYGLSACLYSDWSIILAGGRLTQGVLTFPWYGGAVCYIPSCDPPPSNCSNYHYMQIGSPT